MNTIGIPKKKAMKMSNDLEVGVLFVILGCKFG